MKYKTFYILLLLAYSIDAMTQDSSKIKYTLEKNEIYFSYGFLSVSNMIIDEIPEPFFTEDNITNSNDAFEITANEDSKDVSLDDNQSDFSEDKINTAESADVSADDMKLSHNDNLLLIEIAKEIMKSSSVNHLKETAIFSIMSYLSVEGVSVISPESDESDNGFFLIPRA